MTSFLIAICLLLIAVYLYGRAGFWLYAAWRLRPPKPPWLFRPTEHSTIMRVTWACFACALIGCAFILGSAR
jgi:hypothetical protein